MSSFWTYAMSLFKQLFGGGSKRQADTKPKEESNAVSEAVIALIKAELGDEQWQICRERSRRSSIVNESRSQSPLPSFDIYTVSGTSGQFEFPSYPSGSHCHYAVNEHKAVRLTRANKEIESILAEEWPLLSECNPVSLASLVLRSCGDDARESHSVLDDLSALHRFSRGAGGYIFDENEYQRAVKELGATSVSLREGVLEIRAITLRGWMHFKANLGIEHIRINSNGTVELARRQVISKKLFTSFPNIRY